jgi:hypothetical protein
VADINDRLERLNRREEFARRGQRGVLSSAPDVELDADFAEVLAAVSRVVQRHPGLSVMVAPADGRPGRTVIRVTEHAGGVETAVVAPPPAPRNGNPGLGEPARTWAGPEPATEWPAEQVAGNGGRHADDRYREPPPVPFAPARYAAAPYAAPPDPTGPYPTPPYPTPAPAVAHPAAQYPVAADPDPGPAHPAARYPVAADPAAFSAAYPAPHSAPAYSAAQHTPAAQYAPAAPATPPYPGAASGGPVSGGAPSGQHAAAEPVAPGPPAPGLVTLTDETSQVVARLAQMLREDPSLASGWVRERSP